MPIAPASAPASGTVMHPAGGMQNGPVTTLHMEPLATGAVHVPSPVVMLTFWQAPLPEQFVRSPVALS